MIKLLDEPIFNLINTIIITGMVPDSFKTSIIIPIFKKRTPKNIENHRLINLLTIILKCFKN